MEQSSFWNYALLGGVAIFLLWRKWKMYQVKPLIADYLARKAMIIDVRSPDEFQRGHFDGSINMPLNLFQSRVGDLDKTKPIIVCCASGARSASALSILKSKGFTSVINAGSWQNIIKTRA